MSALLAKVAQRLSGRGPRAVAPFSELAGRLHEAREGLDSCHWSDGVLSEIPADVPTSSVGMSLLGQEWRARAAPAASLSPVRRLYSLRDACVAGADGVVWCPRTHLAVEETVRVWSAPPARHPLLAAPRFPAAKILPSVSLNLGSLDAGGFYHFLHESLPRLALARDYLPRIDHFLCPGRPGSFQAGWLALAGVPVEKIKWLAGLTHWRCEQLLFTNLPNEDCRPSPWLVGVLRDLVGWRPAPGPARRLWLSREDAGSRRLAWESELLTLLPGFEKVVLSGLSATAQVGLFASAAAVAGPHGAAFAHLAFCPPDARAVELVPAAPHPPLYGRLAAAAGVRHAWAEVDFARPPTDLRAMAAAILRFIG
jgi:hypothetical protein